ncbi:MAG: outer membrane beta-barrel protein [Hyphomicrobiales bacterium]|nr:outer membrane beta-barrel protein [Hyphomicrobiales bacterium]OQW83046.1 MAG: hypothetical protein BVN31_07070 [Proteobacteria bacterium ST_bin15]
MNKLSIALAVAASLGLAASSAGAADLIDARPVPHVIPAPIEVASGWYIRGDVGTGVADFRDFTLSPADPALKQVQKSIESPPIIGVGVGYQFNDFLRADITGEYRGNQGFSFVRSDKNDPFQSISAYNGKLSSVLVLANGYIDLGNFYGITPFVGGGVGFAHHRFSGLQDAGYIVFGGGYGYAATRESTEFAWAIHAGLAYAVNENLKLEASYRYANLGSPVAGQIVCQGPGDCSRPTLTARDLTSHDFRLGARWLFNPPQQVVRVERPVIARN